MQASGTATSSDVDAFIAVTRDLVGVALRSIAPEGLTFPQFRLLAVLHENGSRSSAQVARMLDVVPSSVTRMADRLVAAGFIERSGIPEHRGVVALVLSPAGSDLVARVLKRRHDELAGTLDSLEPATRSAAVEAMIAIHEFFRGDEQIGGVLL